MWPEGQGNGGTDPPLLPVAVSGFSGGDIGTPFFPAFYENGQSGLLRQPWGLAVGDGGVGYSCLVLYFLFILGGPGGGRLS